MIAAVLLSLALLVTPAPSEFVKAQAAAATFKVDASNGYVAWVADHSTGPALIKQLSGDLLAVQNIMVEECFSNWWADEYAVAQLTIAVLSTLVETDTEIKDSPEYQQVLRGMNYLDQQAANILPLVDCSVPDSAA